MERHEECSRLWSNIQDNYHSSKTPSFPINRLYDKVKAPTAIASEQTGIYNYDEEARKNK